MSLLAPSPKFHAHEVTGPPVFPPVNCTENGTVPLVRDAEMVRLGGGGEAATEITILAEFDPPAPVAVMDAVYVP
jgi:hypothetical protein